MRRFMVMLVVLAVVGGCYQTPKVGEEWTPTPLYEAQDDDDSAA